MRTVPSLERLEDLVAWARSDRPLFVRYSKGPADDLGAKSVDYESGLELPGLSVNPLQPEPWWARPLEQWIARQLCAYAHLGEGSEKLPWILTGEIVGRGPDNEPLIGPFEPLGYLSDALVAEAQRVYDSAFDVKRRSA
jgi:hypothetical protein